MVTKPLNTFITLNQNQSSAGPSGRKSQCQSYGRRSTGIVPVSHLKESERIPFSSDQDKTKNKTKKNPFTAKEYNKWLEVVYQKMRETGPWWLLFLVPGL